MLQHIEPEEVDSAVKDRESAHKIQALRDMINNAEKTIQGAKAMLLQIEGKKKLGRKRKVEELTDGSVIEGTFDGQIMVGTDGKQYPVPPNYASKSKLIEGDVLKLTITSEGSFIYKQIGPVERRHAIGIISQDERGNYVILAEGKPYKVLLASVTYFKGEPGDEVAVVFPRDLDATWASIEHVLQKGGQKLSHWLPPRNARPDHDDHTPDPSPIADRTSQEPITFSPLETEAHDQTDHASTILPETAQALDAENSKQAIIDEWVKDLEEIENEIKRTEDQ
jgi:hypothetical protein